VPPMHPAPRRTGSLKTAREELDIVNAYRATGSYRGAAALCGTTHKTARRVVERQQRGAEPGRLSVRRERKTDPVRELVERRVRETDGRVSAKRLLPAARAAGYTGSDRTFRRAVAEAKRAWRRQRRVYRPWQPAPGEHLVIDYGTVTAGPLAGLHVFCAVLAWSRVRFVRFCRDQTLATTLRLLADCFETLGAVPAVVLADRMGCLKGGVVANVVVPTAGYVRFATSYGFRPDFCEAADPESKGVVEALVGYAKRDLAVWLEELRAGPADLAGLNRQAAAWCSQVNSREHSESRAVPAERLETERPAMRPLPSLRPTLQAGVTRKVDKLATVRFGSARYSIPARLVGATVAVSVVDEQVVICHSGDEVARHGLVPPGGVALDDAHYDRPARRPSRAVRARTVEEKAFLALGPTAELFLRAAAAAGTPRLAAHVTAILTLEAAHGRAALVAALERATAFRRFTSDDVRAVLAAGPHAPQPRPAGGDLTTALPAAPTRDLAAYRADALAVAR
jgi:transposase